MNTILTRLKTLVENNSDQSTDTLSYIKSVEIIRPEFEATVTPIASLPRVAFVPVSTVEEWIASQEKQATHQVMAYLMLRYFKREVAIVGDTSVPGGQGKGITNIVDDFISVVRGTRLAVSGSNYLHKPLDILNIEYEIADVSQDTSIYVASVLMQCVRLFLQTSLPGDI